MLPWRPIMCSVNKEQMRDDVPGRNSMAEQPAEAAHEKRARLAVP